MLRKWALFLLLSLVGAPVFASNISGDVRGVTFFYLDGERQDFPWVLENQYDPVVRQKIDNLLAQYRLAGVNWIRLLVATDHFPDASQIHPLPSSGLIRKVNDFMAITRAGANSGKFTIEIVFVPQQRNGLFTDAYPFARDKAWFKAWLDGLNYANLGMVMFGGDLSPCHLDGCAGDSSANALVNNHGTWIKSMWDWKQANYPKLNASYEVIAVQGLSNNDPALIKKLAIWMEKHTPTNPIFAASLYILLPSGSSWQDYANATAKVLDSYHSVSSKMLWIDEFGKSFGTDWVEKDQQIAYSGFLGASVCWRQKQYPKFAWAGSNDYPYDGKNWFGLVSGFTGAQPNMRDAWVTLGAYYTLQACP